MRKSLVCLHIAALFYLFLSLFIVAVNAENVTITLSDLNIQKGVKIIVYDYQGKLVGEFNTTDTITLNTLNASSYIFVLKPSEQSWFSNPFQAIELLKVSAPIILSYLLFAAVIVGLGYLLVRIFR